MSGSGDHHGSGTDVGGFELTRFFPYRLAVLAERVSLAVSQLYTDRFDLNRPEWRILAALGANPQMAAKDLAPYSTLDKMQVSRAVAKLEADGLIEREDDTHDRRAKILRLTAAGRALHRKIVPLVVARENHILGALTPEEREALDRIMTKIQARASDLIDWG